MSADSGIIIGSLQGTQRGMGAIEVRLSANGGMLLVERLLQGSRLGIGHHYWGGLVDFWLIIEGMVDYESVSTGTIG